MKINSAEFVMSAPTFSACPLEQLPEFAFIGRSNVGKSTLINQITGKTNLARVSETPGFTNTINFFSINRTLMLVDLPGYGFAKASHNDRAQFARLIEDYLINRSALQCVFVLVDVSIRPQAIDLDFVDWIGKTGRPFALVFTKSDKAKPEKSLQHMELFMKSIPSWFAEPPPVFLTSAKNQRGIKELRSHVFECAADFNDPAHGGIS